MTAQLSAFLVLQAALGQNPTPQLHQDFRAKKFNDQLFAFEGPKAKSFITPEIKGLRITLPVEDAPNKPVGIRLRQDLKGDFVATVAYELLDVSEPAGGSGSGVSLYLMLRTPVRDGINFARFVQTKRGHVYTLSHMVDDENDNKKRIPKTKYTVYRANPNILAGNLRVARQGETLTVSASEGDPPVFKELGQLEVGPADISMVRIAADQGGAKVPVPVDVRIVDFMVTSGEFTPHAPLAPPSSGSWHWPVIIAAIILAAGLFFGVRFWLAKRAKAPEGKA